MMMHSCFEMFHLKHLLGSSDRLFSEHIECRTTSVKDMQIHQSCMCKASLKNLNSSPVSSPEQLGLLLISESQLLNLRS